MSAKQRERTRQRRRRLRAERPRATRFQSETSDREYITTYRRQPVPVATCNCPGYLSHGHCWHEREVLGKEADMTTALQPYRVQPPTALLPTTDELNMIRAIAQTASKETSLLPKIAGKPMTEGQAAVIMLYGREMGVQPLAALNQIYVVNGRPQASAQLMIGLMQSADPNAGVEILERTIEKARVRITYKGRSQTFEATMDDAKRANLTKNPVWSSYPKQMLVWTAVRTGVRLMAPDALNALAQLPPVSEAEALIPEGDTIEAEAVAVSVVDEEPSLTEDAEADITPEPEPDQPAAAEPEPEPCSHDRWQSIQGAIVCKSCGVHRADLEAADEAAETKAVANHEADAKPAAPLVPPEVAEQPALPRN